MRAQGSGVAAGLVALGDLEAIGALAVEMVANRFLQHQGQGFVFHDAEQTQRAVLLVVQRDGDARQSSVVNDGQSTEITKA